MEVATQIAAVVGLFLTAYSMHKEAEARRISNLIALVENHHSIWKELHDRGELSRIRDKGADLATKPLSDEERVFVTSVVLHSNTVYRASKAGMFVKVHAMRKDLAAFFSLPVPKAVWKTVREFQEEDFIAFVDASLEDPAFATKPVA